MNRLFLFLTIFLFSENIIGKTDSTLFFNEFSISLNRTAHPESDIKARIGFGFGAYHLFRPEKIISFKLGLEFNRTRRFEELTFLLHHDGATYSINNITFPITIRTNIGKRYKFILESGIFLDYLISSWQNGLIQRSKSDNSGSELVHVKEKVKNSTFGYGFSGSAGFIIPIEKKELIIKYELVMGLNFYSFDNAFFFNRYVRLVFGVRI